jgi:membrane fusion protein (multidrug efflux system)
MTAKRRLWTIIVPGLFVVVFALGGVKAMQIGAMIKAGKSFSPPPESVTTAPVQQTEWQASNPAIGSLVAVHGVTLAAELPGTVREIWFDSSAAVRQGDKLVKLDTSVEEAQLTAAGADATLAKQSVERSRHLRKGDYATAAELDAAEARLAAAEATVAQLRATIAKKTIRAPFDGRLGVRQVELGQVLSPGTPIATLQSLDPIYAEFWLPQQTLSDLHRGMAANLTTDAYPNRDWQGRISTVSPDVDVATRNVRVRATFANPDQMLLPGMFANVEVLSPDKRRVLVIPATAVLYAPYGDSVFTVVEKKEGDKTRLVAQQNFVRLGQRRGDLVAVDSGLDAGETVVSSGAFKLRNGMTLVVKNDLAPDVQVNPKPTDR